MLARGCRFGRPLTLRDVTKIATLSRSVVYALTAESRFPKPSRIGSRAVPRAANRKCSTSSSAAPRKLGVASRVATMWATFYNGNYRGECETWWYRLTVRDQSDKARRAGALRRWLGHWVD